MSDADKRERNRRAAQKCRKNKEEKMQNLKKKNDNLKEENKKLSDEKRELKQQALEYRKSVDMHCQKGCKIPREMKELWDKEMEDSSSDESESESESEANTQEDPGVLYGMYTSAQHNSGNYQDLENPFSDNIEHAHGAPIALFSGVPLNTPRMTRDRKNSSHKSATSSHLSSVEVSGVLESNSLVTSVNDVRMQIDTTAATSGATNIPTALISNTHCGMGNATDTASVSQDIMQLQNAFPVVEEPRSEMGTHGHLLDNPSISEAGEADQMAMEYQTVRDIEVGLLSSEADVNQNLPSSFPYYEAVKGYTYIEDLLRCALSAGNIDSQNHEMQDPDVSNNNGNSYSQSQSLCEQTIPVQAMASALLNLGPDMAPSLQQQLKMSLDSRSVTHQIHHIPQNIHPPTTSRQAGPRRETTTREAQAGTGQSLRLLKGNSMNQPIQATVLSEEQLFKQKPVGRHNTQNRPFTERSASVVSNQQAVQQGQQATWSSSTNRPHSRPGNSASHTATLLKSKSPPVIDLMTQKDVLQKNALSTPTVTNYKETVNLSQLGCNTSPTSVNHVAPRTSTRTINQNAPNTTSHVSPNTTLHVSPNTTSHVSPNTTSHVSPNTTSHVSPNTTPHVASFSSSPTFRNTTSDQVAQHSLGQQINVAFRHGQSRLAATNNNHYVSFSSQNLASQINKSNTEHGFIPTSTTSNSGSPSNNTTGLKITCLQYQPEMRKEKSTEKDFIPKFETSRLIRLQSGTSATKRGTSDKSTNEFSHCNSPSSYTGSTQQNARGMNFEKAKALVDDQQPFTNTTLALATSNSSQKLQLQQETSSSNVNGYSPNTGADCNGTENLYGDFVITSSETGLQPTINFSNINVWSQQAPFEALGDHMSMTETPHGSRDYSSAQSSDIDFLSASPQAIESERLVSKFI